MASNPDAREPEHGKREIRDPDFQLEGIASRPADVQRRLICSYCVAHKREHPAETDRNGEEIEEKDFDNSWC